MATKNNSTLTGSIKIQESLLEQAVKEDLQALILLFKQFIPEDEQCYFLQYLGRIGFLWFSVHSFACLTNRRVATIRIGRFGEVVYQDGFLELINSSATLRSSKLGLYLYVLVQIIIFSPWSYSNLINILLNITPPIFINILISVLMSVLLIPLSVRWYYQVFKCGLVFHLEKGTSVYIFTNHRFLKRVNVLSRHVTACREAQLKVVKHDVSSFY